MKAFDAPPTSSRHDTYGVLPENVMSGRVESPVPVEIGAPPLAISKCASAPVPTRCETNTCLTPPTCSSQVIQGEVGLAGFIVPAATRGFSASPFVSLFSEQRASVGADSAHLPILLVPLVSSVALNDWPTTTQWNPPLAASPSLTPLAANTISFSCRPAVPLPFSYQTIHGTPSFTPVNAMSGSTPSRVVSTFRLGSSPTRGIPVCCQQMPPIAGTCPSIGTPAGLTPSQLAAPGPIGLTE